MPVAAVMIVIAVMIVVAIVMMAVMMVSPTAGMVVIATAERQPGGEQARRENDLSDTHHASPCWWHPLSSARAALPFLYRGREVKAVVRMKAQAGTI
jgi:hypothetical protein